MRRGRHVASLAGLALGLLAPGAGAEEIPEARVALVMEFLRVTEGDANVEGLREIFVGRVDQAYPQIFEGLLDEMDLSTAEREALKERFGESRRRFTSRFDRLFGERIDLEAMTRILYAPIYTRHFSDDDLRQLTAFYRTPLGQKALVAVPRAMEDIAREVGVAMGPHVERMIEEVAAEETRVLREAL